MTNGAIFTDKCRVEQIIKVKIKGKNSGETKLKNANLNTFQKLKYLILEIQIKF